MAPSYWPWWAGALALAAVTLGFLAVHRRGLGVSGLYATLLGWRGELELARLERDEEALRAALVEATRQRFGDDALEMAEGASSAPAPRRLSLGVGLVFLFGLSLGGRLAASLHAPGSAGLSLGADFERLLGGGVPALVTLLAGGILVGFGTRMAAGCTSGHGLSGCARLRPASLVATLSFFSVAVVVSFLIGWLG
jgi:uncharacterized membrane protein YedE/YeeE